MQEPARILLCLRYGIGDLIMELPALDLLRAAYPQATITGIGAEPAIELLEGDRRIDVLVPVQRFGFTHWGDWGTEQARRALAQWLDQEAFDLILDPSHAVIAVGEAIWARKVAIRDSGRELSTDAVRAGAEGPGALRQAIAEGWGLSSERPWLPRIPVQPLEPAMRERVGALPRPLIGISTVASSPLKRWAPERFAELMERVRRRYAAGFVVLTGPEPLPEALSASLEDASSLHVGAVHLRQVASILAHCDLLVCNDTGVMHLAAAVGTRPVAVFGPTAPKLYLPAGAVAVGPKLPECPVRMDDTFGPPRCVVEAACLNDSAGEGCISRISVSQVETALCRAVEERAGQPFAR